MFWNVLGLFSGWDVGEGSDLPGDLRLVGRAAAPGSRHPGPGLLLGLHEGQPAPPELHIEPASICGTSSFQFIWQEERWLQKKNKTPKTEYLFKSTYKMKKASSSSSLSLLVKCVSKTGQWGLLQLYIYW